MKNLLVLVLFTFLSGLVYSFDTKDGPCAKQDNCTLEATVSFEDPADYITLQALPVANVYAEIPVNRWGCPKIPSSNADYKQLKAERKTRITVIKHFSYSKRC